MAAAFKRLWLRQDHLPEEEGLFKTVFSLNVLCKAKEGGRVLVTQGQEFDS